MPRLALPELQRPTEEEPEPTLGELVDQANQPHLPPLQAEPSAYTEDTGYTPMPTPSDEPWWPQITKPLARAGLEGLTRALPAAEAIQKNVLEPYVYEPSRAASGLTSTAIRKALGDTDAARRFEEAYKRTGSLYDAAGEAYDTESIPIVTGLLEPLNLLPFPGPRGLLGKGARAATEAAARGAKEAGEAAVGTGLRALPAEAAFAMGARQPWERTQRNFIANMAKEPGPIAKSLRPFAGQPTAEENAVFHKSLVEKALAEGKPVPPEVLVDYPDLAKGAAAVRPPESLSTSSGAAAGVTPSPAAPLTLEELRAASDARVPIYPGPEGAAKTRAEMAVTIGATGPTGDIVGATLKGDKIIWARPLPNTEMVAGAFKDNWGRKIVKTPGIKQAMNLLDPAALVSGTATDSVNQVGRGLLLRNRVLDVGDSGTQAGLALLQEKKFPFTVDGTALVISLPGKPSIYTVLETPGRFKLTPEQADYARLFNEMVEDATRLAKENGINIKELNLGDERNYIPRLVEAIRGLENPRGATVGGGVGAKQAFQKTRFYDWAEEGVANGVVYSGDPISIMQFHVSGVYRAIADKRLADEVVGLGETILQRVEAKAPGLLAARDISKKEFQRARALLSAVNRSYRGERLPPALVSSIERSFPQEAAALRAAGPNSPALQPIEASARNLMASSRADWQNISLKVGNLKEALKPGFDEGQVWQPVFNGRIFPKEVSDKLNQALGDKGQEWLRSLEKVNLLSRTATTIFDFGAPFIQGLPVLGRDPKAWAFATMKHYQAFLSPPSFARYKAANQEVLREMSQHGVGLGGSEFLAGVRPAQGLEKLLTQKIPQARQVTTWLGRQTAGRFQESFGAFLDVAATEEWKALRTRALREGPNSLFALGDTVNHLRGTMSQRAIGIGATQQQIEGTFMAFAPRYTKAGFALMADAMQGGIKGEVAREAMAGMAATGFLTFLAAGTAMTAKGLMTQKELEERLQPIRNGRFNTKFMTLPIGTDNVGYGSFYYGWLKMLAGTVDSALNDPEDFLSLDSRDNPIVQFMSSRMIGASPLSSLAIELKSGTTWNGERLTTLPDYAKAVGRKLLPFWAESYLLQEPRQSGEAFLPSIGGLRVFPDSYGKLAQELEQKLLAESGLPDNKANRRLIAEGSPELQELQRKADEQSAGYRKNPVEQDTDDFYAGIDSAKTARERELQDVYAAFADGRIDGETLRDARSNAMTKFAGGIDGLQREYPLALVDRAARESYYRQERIDIKSAATEDLAAEGYYNIEPPLVNGVEDMNAFYKNRDKYLKQFDPDTQEYILHKYPSKRYTQDWMNKIEEQYLADQETLKPYWEIADQYRQMWPWADSILKEIESVERWPPGPDKDDELKALRATNDYKAWYKAVREDGKIMRQDNDAVWAAGERWHGWTGRYKK